MTSAVGTCLAVVPGAPAVGTCQSVVPGPGEEPQEAREKAACSTTQAVTGPDSR